MSILKANCPNCAGPIEFKNGASIVKVCEFCRSAVHRTDRKLEDVGRVAEIVESKSPLKLGIRGEYNGSKFELTGRAQIKHGAGGFWDEWYATFSNGWVGWLAEAQGKFYMTFYKPIAEGFQIPSFEQIRPGQRIDGISDETHLIVNEKGTAKYIAAEGEIPYELKPNEQSDYADLVGKDGVFATIDYSTNPPYIFYGKELTLADMGLAEKRSAERPRKEVEAGAMGCPKCGGTLELKAPDQSERVTCPYCASLLGINNGELKFLQALKKKPPHKGFVLDIGAKGKFDNFADGVELEIIGAMKRSVSIDRISYYWDEYLLYNPKVGFKWLVNSENHWNFVDSVNPADISNSDNDSNEAGLEAVSKNKSILFGDNSFKAFAGGEAKVRYVKGEFYWQVEQGETAGTFDYISPPYILSKEVTANEINWSLGNYLGKEEIEKAFSVSDLPNTYSIAPNQPFKHNSVIRIGLIMFGVFVVVSSIVGFFTGNDSIGETKKGKTIEKIYGLEALKSAEDEITFYTPPFKLNQGTSNELYIAFRLDYETWSEFNLDIVPAKTGEYKLDTSRIEPLTTKHPVIDKFQGSLATWTTKTKYFETKATAEYQIKISGKWKEWKKPILISVTVYEAFSNKPTSSAGRILLIILFLLVPIIVIIYKYSFETRRWKESDFPNQTHLTNIFFDIFSRK